MAFDRKGHSVKVNIRLGCTSPASTLKVALACPGLGHYWRGFETFPLELGPAIKDKVDLTVFGSKDLQWKGVHIHRLPTLRRTARLGRLRIPARQAYALEQFIFMLGLIRKTASHRYDVIHLSDRWLAKLMTRAVRRLGLHTAVILRNGGNYTPDHLAEIDHCQVVTPAQLANALEYGIPAQRLTLLPRGIACNEFSNHCMTSTAARRALGLSETGRIVLSVAAIEREKRITHLVDEICAIGDNDLHLLVVGQTSAESHAIEAHARRRLSDRYRSMIAPYELMPLVYRAADVMVLCRLNEGFGNVVLEAMAARIPVLVHDCELFRWMVPSPSSRIDMAKCGELSVSLETIHRDKELASKMIEENYAQVISQFDWPALVPSYLAMYERLRAMRS